MKANNMNKDKQDVQDDFLFGFFLVSILPILLILVC
jgi:hypothetical protein